jgi:hypothetical protein
VALFDSNGALEQLVRWDLPRHPVSEAAVSRWREQVSQQRAAGAVTLDSFPSHYPPYGMAMGDANGDLWLWTGSPEEPVPFRWTVIERSGRLIGSVELPTTFLPYQVGGDFVLTRYWDEFRVEYVRLYRLLKDP